MNRPFFSVLLPAYNARFHIRRALKDLLGQTFRDFEILVVDDGSTDETGSIVREFHDARIRLVSLEKNCGLVGALNEGLAKARGLWVARQDADDRCRPERLERQKNLISKNPGAVLFYSRAKLINEQGWWRGNLRPPLVDAELRWDLCFRNSVPHTSVVFPLDLVRDGMGGYAGDNVTADFDLWSRLLRKGSAVGDARNLVAYRNHSGSIMGRENTAVEKRSNKGLGEILCQNLREWAGADEGGAERISAGWLEPAGADWEEYFSIREKLASGSLIPSGGLVAEEDYTLLHRALGVSTRCASALLLAMQRVCPLRYAALPRFRTLAVRLLGRF